MIRNKNKMDSPPRNFLVPAMPILLLFLFPFEIQSAPTPVSTAAPSFANLEASLNRYSNSADLADTLSTDLFERAVTIEAVTTIDVIGDPSQQPLSDDGRTISTKVLLGEIETLSTEPTSVRAQLSEHDYSSIKSNDLNTTTSTDGQSGTTATVASITTQSITVFSTALSPDDEHIFSAMQPGANPMKMTTTAGPRKKVRRSTTSTSTVTPTPLINTSAVTAEDIILTTLSSAIITTPDADASISPVSPRPKTKKLKKKVSKKGDSFVLTTTPATEVTNVSQAGDETTGTELSKSNEYAEDELTPISIIESTITRETQELATIWPPHAVTSTESVVEEQIRAIKKPRKKPKFMRKFDHIDSVDPNGHEMTMFSTPDVTLDYFANEEQTSSSLNIVKDSKTTTTTMDLLATKLYLTTESILTAQSHTTTNSRHNSVSTELTTESDDLVKAEGTDDFKSAFVTQTPFEVLISRNSDFDLQQRRTSTTLFEDKSTVASASTGFISLQSMESLEKDIFNGETTIIGTEESIINEDNQSMTSQTVNSAELPKQETTIPTTEPRVEGINVENVEESLSPIAEDDVLVVEIEESSETAEIAEETVAFTTTIITSEVEAVLTHETPSQRPKLNDELFFPINVPEGGGSGNNRPLGNSDDDERNDNDGDFDLEAEIFPTIPAPKNTLFESEILREKVDLEENSPELANIQLGSVKSTTEAAMSTPLMTTTTSTTTATLTPDRIAEINGNTVTHDDTDVSTVGHDSDTFFYISNTEVKVVESVDATPSEPQQPHKELSFPENTHEEDVFITLSDQNHSDRGVAADQLNHHHQLRQENIILSPVITMYNSGGGGGNNGNEHNNDFDYVKFNVPEAPQKLPSSADGDAAEEIETAPFPGQLEEQLSFIKVEETTDTYSSEEGFEFLHNDRAVEQQTVRDTTRETSKDAQIPDVIIEPYPQLMDTDNDLPFSIGVPVIAELPPQIKISVNEDENSPYTTERNQLPLNYHSFDIDNAEVEKTLETNYKPKFSSKSKKAKNKKKSSKKTKVDHFSDTILENTENYLVKNPSISLEIPALDFNFTLLTSTTTLVPNLNFTNETTLFLEEDIPGLNDLQTLFLACFITLILLILAVIMALLARFMWRKHYSNGTGLIGDNSTDPLATKSMTLSVDELKSSESGYSHFKNHDSLATPTDQQHGNGIVAANTLLSHIGGAESGAANNGTLAKQISHSSNNYTAGANGSIITMTLKNNHLIVETEERSDMSRDTRETKMHYSPSEKDGVFVVEVARGADTSYHSPQSTNTALANGHPLNGVDLLNTSSSYNSCTQEQRVQIHHHPAPLLKQPDGGAITNGKVKCSTGLSQSDLSDSSSAGSNKEYKYGSQEPYTVGASTTKNTVIAAIHPHRPVAKQETIDLQPRLQSDIDLFNMETERREHCNGAIKIEPCVPDIILVKSMAPDPNVSIADRKPGDPLRKPIAS